METCQNMFSGKIKKKQQQKTNNKKMSQYVISRIDRKTVANQMVVFPNT